MRQSWLHIQVRATLAPDDAYAERQEPQHTLSCCCKIRFIALSPGLLKHCSSLSDVMSCLYLRWNRSCACLVSRLHSGNYTWTELMLSCLSVNQREVKLAEVDSSFRDHSPCLDPDVVWWALNISLRQTNTHTHTLSLSLSLSLSLALFNARIRILFPSPCASPRSHPTFQICRSYSSEIRSFSIFFSARRDFLLSPLQKHERETFGHPKAPLLQSGTFTIKGCLSFL